MFLVFFHNLLKGKFIFRDLSVYKWKNTLKFFANLNNNHLINSICNWQFNVYILDFRMVVPKILLKAVEDYEFYNENQTLILTK